MGYYITMRGSDFFIAKERKDEALALFKENMLSRVNELGQGGRYGKDGKEESWFSWTDTRVLQEAETIEEVLSEFGWPPETDYEGNIIDVEFERQKAGQEDLLFETIAPSVREGSFIAMEGEDGELWRWYFDGEQMLDQTGRVSYA